ncbi:Sulfotransfer 1 domain containing protein [Asbolus verrucosus]|uniref:Sulfotransfer 1 domain containing protein n=1 Tax=Asbolus verrucosus TaxID=1661398 RepID=A0A482VAD5_ASBVE|nr:Sulfotransfer 1 domain containing protein [Asbolus verrucosus]
MDNTLKLSDHELNKILQEKFSIPSCKLHIKIENFTLIKKYLQFKKTIDELEILDTDIFVCGLPRSGTTWLSEMVWLISHDLDYENAKNNLLEHNLHSKKSSRCLRL